MPNALVGPDLIQPTGRTFPTLVLDLETQIPFSSFVHCNFPSGRWDYPTSLTDLFRQLENNTPASPTTQNTPSIEILIFTSFL